MSVNAQQLKEMRESIATRRLGQLTGHLDHVVGQGNVQQNIKQLPRIFAAKLKLDWLMEEFKRQWPGSSIVVLQAPVKNMGRGAEKVWHPKGGGVPGDWLDLKDYARTTLVLPDDSPPGSPQWEALLGAVRKLFQDTGRYGFTLVKDEKKDGKKSGYTDHNFVGQFGRYPFYSKDVIDSFFGVRPMPTETVSAAARPMSQYANSYVEIQINNVNMMYAKMKRKVIDTHWGASTYANYEATIGLEGGLGHALYEIIRTYGEESNLGREVSQVSRDYYLRCKKTIRKPMPPRVDFLKVQLERLKTMVPHELQKKQEVEPEYLALKPADYKEAEV